MHSLWMLLSYLRIPVYWVFPFLADARDWRKVGKVLRWIIHVLIIVGIVLFLYWLQNYVEVVRKEVPNILSTSAYGLDKVFFPLLFLLVYAFGWLAWFIWRLLTPEAVYAEFPDIDQAWAEIKSTLRQTGLSFTDAPMFLVLGKSQGGEESLFQAAQFPFQARCVPRRADAPVRLYSNRDAIFITCPNASLLGKHASLLAGDADSMIVASQPELAAGEGIDPFLTMQPKGQAKEVMDVLEEARLRGRSAGQLTEDERMALAMRARKPLGNLLRNREQMELHAARLRYVCKLIVAERRPYIPINGIMLIVPYHATDSDEDCNDTSLICQRDLAVARETLQVNCPVFAMVADLESLPGFDEFIERFPDDQRQRRVGQRFPLVPDIAPEQLPAKAEEAVRWVCVSLVPTWVYKLFHHEGPNGLRFEDAIRGNVKLYRLMSLIRERNRRLGRIVNRALSQEGDPVMFGGCYIAGTGREASRQAFIPGIFRRLLEEQDNVIWTQRALADEANYRRLANLGYAAIVVMAVSVAGLLYYLFTSSK